MLKKCTISVLFTVLALAGVANAAYSGTPTPKADFGKDGDCYKISTAEDLYGFAAIVNGGESDACGVLTADIVVNTGVLTSAGELNTAPTGVFTPWTPIGGMDVSFKGFFDGQGHTISGLYFNDDWGSNIGLFGSVNGENGFEATIKNVGIKDSYFRAGFFVGGVVGYVFGYGSLDIENVFNAAYVEAISEEEEDLGLAGGLVGYVENSDGQDLILNITNAYNVGSIKGVKESLVGGLVGKVNVDMYGDVNESEVYVNIKNAFNYGKVNGGPIVSSMVFNENLHFDIQNSYYLAEESAGMGKSATDFSNGTVYAALHSAEGGEVWRQYSGDAYPTFVEKRSVTLHYSATESETIYFAEGAATPLPTADAAGNVYIWYDNSDLTGTQYSEIPATATSDLQLYPKKMNFVDGYYEIADADMLFKFAELVNTQNSTYGSAKVKLTADIVVNDYVLKNASGESCVNDDGSYKTETCSGLRVWTPIGMSNSNAFKGSFDGQGHTISGLYVNKPQGCYGKCPDNENIGLFGTVANATVDGTVFIRNVGVEDSYFAGHGHIGGIVGIFNSNGNLNIENSYSVGTIYAVAQSGGLAGYIQNTNVKIENSYSYGDFKCHDNCGALVGPLNSATANVVNSFYLEGVSENWSGDFGFAVADSAAFKNGTVALLLHGDGASVWGQKVGTDSHPNFYKGIEGATPSENGPGVITGGPATHHVTLTYPDGSDSSFIYVEGWGAKLPEKDKEGNDVIWYDENDLFYIDVPSTADGDLNLHAVVFQPGDDDVYVISDAASLYKFAAIVNGGNSTAKAKLENDFVVNENVLATAGGVSNVDATTGDYIGTTTGLREWTPINNFNGTFDGQGHSISGLYFNDENVSNVGLFGSTLEDGEDASIKNVGVEDSYFRGEKNVGGILGYVEIGAIANIENVYNAAVVVGSDYVGGIIGRDYGTESHVANAYNVGSVLGDNCVGGIVGDNYSDNVSSIENSYNYGNVSGNSDVGPLVGKKEGYLSVTNSYYLGDAKNGSYGTNMTSTEFANRTVLAALNPAEGDAVWEQGKDYPVLLVFSKFKPNADGYYEIATADDLYKFAEIVNNGTVPDAKAMLVADICVNACGDGESVLGENNANVDATTGEYIGSTSGLREWTPIGNGINKFQGTFNGQGHTISGLYFNNINAEEAGLFGDVNGTVTIYNVGLVDSYIKGGIVVGGLVGYAWGSSALTISNSYNASFVNAPIGKFGGLVGGAGNESSLTISNSYNEGSLNGQAWGGGLVGYAYDLNVSNSYNAGSVYITEGGVYVGGITSEVDGTATITNSFNYGEIDYPEGNRVSQAGLVAAGGSGSVTVSNSYYLGSEANGDYGEFKSADEFADGTVLIALRSGDDGSVWVQNPNDKYPSIDINATNANTIVLDWSTAADSTTLAAKDYSEGDVVIVKAGKTFYADGKIYEGVLSAEQVAAIGDNKLYPVSGLKLENVSGKLVATLDGDSKESVMIPTDVAVDKVIYKRDVENGKALATIMLPFSAPLTSLNSDFKICQFTRMEINDKNRYEVHVSGIKENFDANTPYIIRPLEDVKKIVIAAEGSAENPLILNSFTGAKEKSVTTKDGVEWTMKGVYDYKVWEAGNPELGSVYGFAAENMSGAKIGEFRKLGANASIQPMRMYLLKSAAPKPLTRPGLIASFAQVEEMSVNVDVVDDDEDQSMLINRITVVPTVVKSNRWFDMKGRALGGEPTAKGTYYYNGKRIIIK